MRYSNQVDGCQIWLGYEGVGSSDASTGEIHVEDSPRAGGRYTITREAKWRIQDGSLDDFQKARLTTLLIDQRQIGVRWPKVTATLIDDAKRAPTLPVFERADRLLRFIAEQVPTIGTRTQVVPDIPAAYAWSESTNWQEVEFCLDYLKEQGWIRGVSTSHGTFVGTVTVAGYGRIGELKTNVDSAQAFVAMWFDDSMNEAYEKGIKPAIENTGYNPFKISDKPDVDKIDDEIIGRSDVPGS